LPRDEFEILPVILPSFLDAGVMVVAVLLLLFAGVLLVAGPISEIMV